MSGTYVPFKESLRKVIGYQYIIYEGFNSLQGQRLYGRGRELVCLDWPEYSNNCVNNNEVGSHYDCALGLKSIHTQMKMTHSTDILNFRYSIIRVDSTLGTVSYGFTQL